MIKPIPLTDARRKSRRQNYLLRATLVGGPDDHPRRVRDLSAEGMKIELDAIPETPIKRGETVTVQMRGIGRGKAEIVWRLCQWYGLRFARPIKPEQAMKPVGKGYKTPDFVKPVLVPGRSLKYVQGV